jgi:hypothetical protein
MDVKEKEEVNSEESPPRKVSQDYVPSLPCFSFHEHMVVSKSLLRTPVTTKFEEGGKLIRMVAGSSLLSSISFTQGCVEMRLKLLGELSECLHVGVVEEGGVGTDYESRGHWGCLHNNCK